MSQSLPLRKEDVLTMILTPVTHPYPRVFYSRGTPDVKEANGGSAAFAPVCIRTQLKSYPQRGSMKV